MNKLLNKSKLQNYLQCPKRLFLEVHHPELDAEDGNSLQFMMGRQVGEVARTLFPGGVLIPHGKDMPGMTEDILANSPDKPVYEATFRHENVQIRADILQKSGDGYELYEVKSATKVKPEYHSDCAIQAWVIQSQGLPLNNIYLTHINNQFVYGGDGDYRGLFHHTDLTSRVWEDIPKVAQWVDDATAMLDGDLPETPTGEHCSKPYVCPYWQHCHGEQPQYPVTSLPRVGKLAGELLEEGIADIRDVPVDRLTNEKHIRIQNVVTSGQPYISPELYPRLASLDYPRYYIDFETIRYIAPIWEGTRPYEQLPFQWSCHIEEPGGKLTHREFLDISGDPPMRGFAESLIQAVGTTGPVIVYGTFENTILEGLAKRFPDLADQIQAIQGRIVNLLKLLENHYYHPAMHGSWSIKVVLPVLVPELRYSDLERVHDGSEAQMAYLEAMTASEERKQQLTTSLLEYCKLDTLAMVRIIEKLLDDR